MVENIPTFLVSFAGSGVAGFFMGMFLRRELKFLVSENKRPYGAGSAGKMPS
jgi:hypothetical protein